MVVLAAVDVDTPPHRPIEVGYDLALAYDDRLVVLYVMSNEEFEQQQRTREDELPADLDQYDLEMASGAAAEMADDAVDATLDAYDVERIETSGSVGSPAEAIPEVASELDPRYVVVGGRKRLLATQALFGSVSQEVIRNVEQPVVTLMETE